MRHSLVKSGNDIYESISLDPLLRNELLICMQLLTSWLGRMNDGTEDDVSSPPRYFHITCAEGKLFHDSVLDNLIARKMLEGRVRYLCLVARELVSLR